MLGLNEIDGLNDKLGLRLGLGLLLGLGDGEFKKLIEKLGRLTLGLVDLEMLGEMLIEPMLWLVEGDRLNEKLGRLRDLSMLMDENDAPDCALLVPYWLNIQANIGLVPADSGLFPPKSNDIGSLELLSSLT